MNLPDTPVEKTIKDAEEFLFHKEKFAGRYNFIGYLDDGLYLVLTEQHVHLTSAAHVAYLCKAKLGDVIAHKNKLYAWCDTGSGRCMWLEFTPGPCTIYDGPRPEPAKKYKYMYDLRYPFTQGDKDVCIIARADGSWNHWEAKIGEAYMYDGNFYTWTGKPDGWVKIDKSLVEGYNKEVNMAETRYDRIPHGWMAIKNVVFNDPATIVMWQDGTKTIVKCGENDEYDPEKGLAMAIAKKAFGNQGNYYNQIRKWLPEPEEDYEFPTLTLSERLNRVFGDPRITDAKKKLAEVQDLICDMTFRGATKAELVRAIKYSKDLIDFCKGVNVDVDTSAERYGVIELSAKYQPK